tara:strand:+ start:1171 stop:1908 length:738 start_codon:yes stop_codon:yes gene_type:complete
MYKYPLSIKQFGEKAIIVEWPHSVEEAILYDILQFRNYLNVNFFKNNSYELVIAYNSLTLIFYDINFDFNKTRDFLLECYKNEEQEVVFKNSLWRIPVCYEEEFGIDLIEVAEKLMMTPIQVIKNHTMTSYTVYGIGFLPGFMYLGGVSEEMEIPRRSTPRLKVAKGAVGLASKQTGIYPQESPGGWNIIGNCPYPLFNAKDERPIFVSVGDKIEFYAVTKSEYDLLKIEIEIGIFSTKNMLANG